MADREHRNLSVGETELWGWFTEAFLCDLWERPERRNLFALRWRTQPRIRDVANTLAWSVVANRDKIIPVESLSNTIRSAVLWEFAHWQRSGGNPQEQVSYPLAAPVAEMLDWLVRHEPTKAAAVVAEIVGEADRELGISPKISGESIREALALDGKLAGTDCYHEFLDVALPPDD
ncbi:hypothetical protein DER29_6048 [Micromonospora sp. M71_S20]|uniref:hypothetical protein n=1 Tax=Micromonospora sp. M71_S20 TaxID=592872 RepID=UPI000EB02AC0|nr:hypothetical protein [Micromonospora sp. M71_S20]RLK09543.1 hypothetical protein DER29_6048 [Micromonospora sp. M71_S20]